MGSKKKGDRLPRIPNSPLAAPEIYFYGIVTIGAVIYICYCVYRDSLKYDGILNMYDFSPGWTFLGREQDISNFEWHFWYGWFWTVWPFYLAHVALGKLMEWHWLWARKYGFLLLSLLTLSQLMGPSVVCLFLVQSLVMYVSTLARSAVVVWTTSLGLLSTLNFEATIVFLKKCVQEDEEDRWYYLMMFTLSLANIRCTSFCLEKCWNSQKTDPMESLTQEQLETLVTSDKNISDDGDRTSVHICDSAEKTYVEYSYIDLLVYIFYLPLFFTGPILTYDAFKSQINQTDGRWTLNRCCNTGLNLLRIIFWAFFNEFILHYFYFNALQQSRTVMKSVPLWTLAGIGYCHGQFFMNIYLVMFGFPGCVARIDNLDPPWGPKCISYIYLYSDMWKYFDRGLYSFLKRYIYIPVGGSQHGPLRQFIGSVLCFSYIYYWHGAEYYIFLWILLNFVGVAMETLGSIVTRISFVKYLEEDVLSAAMVQRIHCVCAIPVFLTSCFSIFCFFGGHVVGYIFFERLIIEGWPTSWVMLSLFLYCAIQTAKEINRWQDRKAQKTKKC